MYRAVLARHPKAPGVAEKAQAIEAELSSLAQRFEEAGNEPPSEKLADLEGRNRPPEEESDPDLGAFRSWIENQEKRES